MTTVEEVITVQFDQEIPVVLALTDADGLGNLILDRFANPQPGQIVSVAVRRVYRHY